MPLSSHTSNETLNGLVDEQDILLTTDKIMPIKEKCMVSVSFDKMKASICLYPPSTNGRTCSQEDIVYALKCAKIEYGIDHEAIKTFLEQKEYGTPRVVAVGKPPREGKDAKIEYFFQTDRKMRPQLREDGTHAFFA